jgi:hypothetical protein
MGRPVLQLTNLASRPRGIVWSIMVRTPSWAVVHGLVPTLAPRVEDLDAVHAGRISSEEYRRRFDLLLASRRADLVPGRLLGSRPGGFVPLGDQDSLCCTCSVERAAVGQCHRVWAAPVLEAAGWSIVLDGLPLGSQGALF